MQGRAMTLTYGGKVNDLLRALDSMPSMDEQRGRLLEEFFMSLLNPTSCLHNLIPA